ncbi:hypothetical protein [Deinococcus sp. QL22]|uniref:hypothetical protein n=1 Tax=Deinococcus sp. QL22 TaxID=2939437 RepID=UPI002017085A|nr:hypothetical protein [Deinococcus sp. QL22]UQN04984.1 hypothetical protein M1R55_08660 [Deinococcus sp. QL22]
MPWEETLRELTRCLPERVRQSSSRDALAIEVRYSDYPFNDGWITVGLITDMFRPLTSSGLLFLEAALREACEERGWQWQVTGETVELAGACVTCRAPERLLECVADAATPVEALALALLKVLNTTR